MKRFWNTFCAWLTPGVRGVLCVLAAAYAADLGDRFTHACNLRGWLALSGADFWRGQVWRIITYPLLPVSPLDFFINGILIIMLGRWLERHWSRGQLWTCCGVAAVGAGLVKVLLQPFDALSLSGAAPLVFGLLAAWGWLAGREKVSFGFGEMTARQAALLAAAASFLMILLSAGLVQAVILLSGGAIALGYLWLRLKLLLRRESWIVKSERMSRLEL
ncbi:MAG: rhomboid family intramembrane serine protease [Verrucomicrobiota bacterium]|nr:rhomboid family intramembrane serine protease [Verrucomicrobiota bacterium]